MFRSQRGGWADWDAEVSRERRAQRFDAMIERLIDPDGARRFRAAAPPEDPETCSMCGQFCVYKEEDQGGQPRSKSHMT